MMNNARRTFSIAGLVVLLAGVAAWYRLAPGEAPAGQPALVTIASGMLVVVAAMIAPVSL